MYIVALRGWAQGKGSSNKECKGFCFYLHTDCLLAWMLTRKRIGQLSQEPPSRRTQGELLLWQLPPTRTCNMKCSNIIERSFQVSKSCLKSFWLFFAPQKINIYYVCQLFFKFQTCWDYASYNSVSCWTIIGEQFRWVLSHFKYFWFISLFAW